MPALSSASEAGEIHGCRGSLRSATGSEGAGAIPSALEESWGFALILQVMRRKGEFLGFCQQSRAAGDVCEAEVPGVSCGVPVSLPKGSEHFPQEFPLPSRKSMLRGRAGLANANECQLLGTRAELREESGVGPLADASAGDKVLVIYCLVFSVFWLPWAHLPRPAQGKPTLQAASPAAHPHGAAHGFGGGKCCQDLQFGHLCASFTSSPSPSPATYLRCSVVVTPWKKRNYCLELIFICFS